MQVRAERRRHRPATAVRCDGVNGHRGPAVSLDQPDILRNPLRLMLCRLFLSELGAGPRQRLRPHSRASSIIWGLTRASDLVALAIRPRA